MMNLLLNHVRKKFGYSAGVLMNVFLAFIIFATCGYYQGKSEVLNEPIISELKEGMPFLIAIVAWR